MGGLSSTFLPILLLLRLAGTLPRRSGPPARKPWKAVLGKRGFAVPAGAFSARPRQALVPARDLGQDGARDEPGSRAG